MWFLLAAKRAEIFFLGLRLLSRFGSSCRRYRLPLPVQEAASSGEKCKQQALLTAVSPAPRGHLRGAVSGSILKISSRQFMYRVNLFGRQVWSPWLVWGERQVYRSQKLRRVRVWLWHCSNKIRFLERRPRNYVTRHRWSVFHSLRRAIV